jgi:hypothetical protein
MMDTVDRYADKHIKESMIMMERQLTPIAREMNVLTKNSATNTNHLGHIDGILTSSPSSFRVADYMHKPLIDPKSYVSDPKVSTQIINKPSFAPKPPVTLRTLGESPPTGVSDYSGNNVPPPPIALRQSNTSVENPLSGLVIPPIPPPITMNKPLPPQVLTKSLIDTPIEKNPMKLNTPSQIPPPSSIIMNRYQEGPYILKEVMSKSKLSGQYTTTNQPNNNPTVIQTQGSSFFVIPRK